MTEVVNWRWILANLDTFAGLLGQHAVLAYVPAVLGLVVALLVGIVCARWRPVYPVALAVSTIVFAIPSLALFVLMLPYTGLTIWTALVPLTIYTSSLILRSVVEGVRSADPSTIESARAMGFGRWHRLFAVELPIALPVIIGGVRVAVVANIAMVSVVSVIGLASLGDLFVDGAQRSFLTPILVGIALTLAMAFASDLLLVAVQRLATPWARRREAR